MGQGIGGLEDWGIRERERVRCQRVGGALRERAEASKSGTGQQKVDGQQRSLWVTAPPRLPLSLGAELGEESPTREITENSVS